jgi:hypothetical protein
MIFIRPAKSLKPALLFSLILATACAPPPTLEDKRRLVELEEAFGKELDFQFSQDGLYLEMKGLAQDPPSLEDARNVYRKFWFKGDTPRRDTNYVYLNVYDRHGTFQFQVYWDTDHRRLVRSTSESY